MNQSGDTNIDTKIQMRTKAALLPKHTISKNQSSDTTEKLILSPNINNSNGETDIVSNTDSLGTNYDVSNATDWSSLMPRLLLEMAAKIQIDVDLPKLCLSIVGVAGHRRREVSF